MTDNVIDFPSAAMIEARQMAAVDFEPIDNSGLIADLTEPAWSTMVSGLGVNLRLSAAIVGKTKAGLVEQTRRLRADGGDDLIFETIDCISGAAEHLKSLAEIAEAASLRMMAALSVIAAADDGGSAA